MPFAIQFMVPLFAKTVSITSNWTKWIPNMALVIGENAIDIYKSSKWFGVPDCGSRITSGNTKCITSGNIQKSHTPHTLDPHFGQHGFHHFGQHVKHRSYHLITWLSHLGFGWGWGGITLLTSLLDSAIWGLVGEWGGIILLASLLDSAIHAITSSPDAIIITIMMKMKMNNTRKKKIEND